MIATRLDLAREAYDRDRAVQDLTVQVLSGMGTPSNGYSVDAGPLDVVAHQECENGCARPGTCCFTVWDGQAHTPVVHCPDCVVTHIQRTLVAGDHLAIDVLL